MMGGVGMSSITEIWQGVNNANKIQLKIFIVQELEENSKKWKDQFLDFENL